jgi:hypothetical protein
MSTPTQSVIEAYRCPASFLQVELQSELSNDAGVFQVGPGLICYGCSTKGFRKQQVGPHLYDAAPHGAESFLPFNPTEIVENLRLERYLATRESWIRSSGRKTYYQLRPFLHHSIRRQIQKLQLRGWRTRPFPGWPVDLTVECIHEQVLLLLLRATGADRIPFIWFWPHGKESCVIMTHDVEGEAGRNFCPELMDLDDSYGIKASFQLVPQGSYSVSSNLLATIRSRGFEVGIQDLNHDGRLYDDRAEFLRRANLINQYAREYGANGFRAGVLYRKPEWYDAFDFSFDMSIPNTAHLDPQRGGCCTVMPYFIGNILELPVTATQDYMLAHLLGERSIELWKNQIRLILGKNGLITFIIHPDYVMHPVMRALYTDLLQYVRELQATRKIWLALPSAVDNWWRARAKMQLVRNGDEWHIEGEGAERAVVAYAKNVNGELVYELQAVLAESRLHLDVFQRERR